MVETDYKEHITALVDHLGNRKTFSYDGDENLRSITQLAPGTDRALDAVTRLDYDGSGRLVRLTDPEGNPTSYSYAKEGCSSCGASTELPETITDPFGEVTRQLFDKNGKLVGVKTPLDTLAGVSTGLERDAKGQVTKRTDANGKQTSYQYDALGRVLNQLDANLGLTQFEYDLRGNLIKLTDPENNATTFEYDLAGRKIKESRPLGQATVYSYYKNGLLKTVKDAKGQITTYAYDKANRLKSVTYHDQTQDLFDYDAAGNLTGWSTTGETPVSGTMAYDELNRKTGETVNYGGFSQSYSYGYDHRGNKTGYTSPEGIAHSYEYLLNDRLKTIGFDGKVLALNYDKTRLKQIVYPNGVTADYSYNVGGWLSGIQTRKGLATLLQRDYQFDHVGNIGTLTTQAGETLYGYDDIYQLTVADHPPATGLADENFSYDKVGNRLTSSATNGSWSHNQNHELTDTTLASYEYDANGNTIKKTVGTQVARYEYNARNRLARVILGAGVPGSDQAKYLKT